MPTTTLTDKFCERVKAPSTGRLEYYDKHLPGFGLRVTCKGKKSFCLLYRVNGAKRRLTIGPYTGSGSLKAAREKARKALEAADDGRDPATEKAQTRRQADTVASAVEEFYADHLKHLKDGKKAKRILDSEVVSRWRYRRIAHISRRDIKDMLNEIVERGTPGQADKVRAWTHALMNYAVAEDLIKFNPAANLPRTHKPQVRDKVLGDDELRAIWNGADKLGYPFGPVVKLLMITGQRRSEVCNMRWADLDLNSKLWILADTKGGRPHAVPLPSLAYTVLEDVPDTGSDYLFSTRKNHPVSGLSKAKQRLDTLAGLEGWILHDLRRTVRTGLARLGFEKNVADRVMGHATVDVSRHYDHWQYLPEKRKALGAWADDLQCAINGNRRKVDSIYAS